MYKIDNQNLRAKIKSLEQRLDFQKYNIKEKKQKEKGRKKKKQELLKKKQTKKPNNNEKNKKQKTTNNHPKTIYGVCLKKKSIFLFLKIVIVGYRNKNQRINRRLNN